jgi:ADP-ribosyl-[dinitrogen reductase] hydrolase
MEFLGRVLDFGKVIKDRQEIASGFDDGVKYSTDRIGEGYNSSTGSCFDIGQVTLRAISQFKRTGNPIAGPTKASDGGNGSVMRLAPVALSWWRDPQHAEVIARRQSATTHGSQECLDGCALLSRVLCSGIAGSGVRSIYSDDESWSQSIRNIGLGSWRG